MRDFPIKGNAWLVEQAGRFRRGELQPAAVAPAATVMLVRPATDAGAGVGAGAGVEVFLQQRVASMEFAPSMLVFPGGRVDPRDARADLEWAGRSPSGWADVLATDEEAARLLVTAAIRELFEECGVLLAGPDADSVVADVSSPVWHERRMALTRHEVALADVLAADGLVLRSDLLSYRAHWVTPVFEPKRYDTRFFAATVPPGQVPDGQTSEADHAGWFAPEQTLAALGRGEVMMLPPTMVCLEGLAEADSVDDVVRDEPDVILVMPELLPDHDPVVLRTPLPPRPDPIAQVAP